MNLLFAILEDRAALKIDMSAVYVVCQERDVVSMNFLLDKCHTLLCAITIIEEISECG